jgi:hypothetical protein
MALLPTGGEGGSPRGIAFGDPEDRLHETDEGDVNSLLYEGPRCSTHPLIRAAPPPTFSPEGRREN